MGVSILRLQAVKNKTGLSRSSIYKLISLGQFPRQIKLSKRSSGWIDKEISQWLNDRIALRDKEVA